MDEDRVVRSRWKFVINFKPGGKTLVTEFLVVFYKNVKIVLLYNMD